MRVTAGPAHSNTAGAVAESVAARRARQVVGLVCLGVFMGALDASVVNVAYPTLSAAFAAPLAVVGWVSIAYLLTRSALLAIFGRMSDIAGHKRIYMAGFAVFLAGSVLAGLAPTMLTLILCRVLQAVGSAMLSANSMAILTLHTPRGRLGSALSLVETSVSVALGVGPVIGGILIQTLGWRAIFYLNVPVSLAALWLAGRLLPAMPGSARHERFDLAGAVTFALGLGGVLLGISLAQDEGWSSPLTAGPLLLGLLLLAGFLRAERRTDRPMLDLTLFRNRTFTAANAAKVFAYATAFAVTFTVPFYLERVLAYSPAMLGFAMMPLPAAMAIGALIGGPLSDRLGSRLLAPLGMAVATAGCALFTLVSPAHGYAGLLAAMATLEIGIGLFVAPNDNLIMQSAPRSRTGVASSVLALMRNLGMIFGITFAATALQARIAAHLHAGAPMATATLAAFHDVYWLTALVCLTGLLLCLLRDAPARPGPQANP